MKKVLVTALIFILTFGLVSCSSSGSDASVTSDLNTVGISMPSKYLQRWVQDGEDMKMQFENAGYKVNMQYAADDVNTQVSQIENMIITGVDVIVVAPIDGSALTDVLSKAKEDDIKVVSYDRLIMNTDAISYYATFDNFKVGELQGKYIEEKLGLDKNAGPFNIELFGGSPDDNNANFFFDGAMSVLQPHIDSGKLVVRSGQTKFSNIAIMTWKSELAQARMDNVITANYANGEKLDAVLSPNDSLAIGITSALRNAGYGSADKPFPIITGQDCDKTSVKAIISGEQSMSVFKDTRTLANKTVEMVSSILEGSQAVVNDTETYDNGALIVPAFLCEPVFADITNYTDILIDSGYYTADELK